MVKVNLTLVGACPDQADDSSRQSVDMLLKLDSISGYELAVTTGLCVMIVMFTILLVRRKVKQSQDEGSCKSRQRNKSPVRGCKTSRGRKRRK
jgi:hypothetical protein